MRFVKEKIQSVIVILYIRTLAQKSNKLTLIINLVRGRSMLSNMGVK